MGQNLTCRCHCVLKSSLFGAASWCNPLNDCLVSAQTQIARLAGQNQPLNIFCGNFSSNFCNVILLNLAGGVCLGLLSFNNIKLSKYRETSFTFNWMLWTGENGVLLKSPWTPNLCFLTCSFKSNFSLSITFESQTFSTFVHTEQIFDKQIKCQIFLATLGCRDIYIGTKAARWSRCKN